MTVDDAIFLLKQHDPNAKLRLMDAGAHDEPFTFDPISVETFGDVMENYDLDGADDVVFSFVKPTTSKRDR
jgi:hypothetical protein